MKTKEYTENEIIIRKAVKKFFGGAKYVTPDVNSENYAANFYGDTPTPRLCQRDVCACILTAYGTWTGPVEKPAYDATLPLSALMDNYTFLSLDAVMDQIFSDLTPA